MTKWMKNLVVCGVAYVVGVAGMVQNASAVRIRDVARLGTDAPNELEGISHFFRVEGDWRRRRLPAGDAAVDGDDEAF